MRTLYFRPVVSFFFLLFYYSSQIECLPYFDTWCGPSANLERRSEMSCTRLAGNAGPKKSPKIRHLDTIAQVCRAISLQLRQCRQSEKKLVKQQCLPHMSWEYGMLRPTSGWDLLSSLGRPGTFQRLSRPGSVTARHCSSGRHPSFAALNRGRHLYLAVTLGIGPHF